MQRVRRHSAAAAAGNRAAASAQGEATNDDDGKEGKPMDYKTKKRLWAEVQQCCTLTPHAVQ